MKSSLNDLTQRVAVGSVVSNAMHLQCGVQQRFCLRSRLNCIFAKPISEICRCHNFNYHIYADDTQVYLLITGKIYPNAWKLDYQTLVCGWSQIKPRTNRTYCICTKTPCEGIFRMLSLFRRNYSVCLGIFFDRTLCMQKQASAIIKSCRPGFRWREALGYSTGEAPPLRLDEDGRVY